MAMKVVTKHYSSGGVVDSVTFEKAYYAIVREGHLFVQSEQTQGILAVFAPGQWLTVHEVDAAKFERQGPQT